MQDRGHGSIGSYYINEPSEVWVAEVEGFLDKHKTIEDRIWVHSQLCSLLDTADSVPGNAASNHGGPHPLGRGLLICEGSVKVYMKLEVPQEVLAMFRQLHATALGHITVPECRPFAKGRMFLI